MRRITKEERAAEIGGWMRAQAKERDCMKDGMTNPSDDEMDGVSERWAADAPT